MIPKEEKAGPDGNRRPALIKSLNKFNLPQNALTRKQFLRNLTGRILTASVALAEASHNDRLVNHLLKIKDTFNRRKR